MGEFMVDGSMAAAWWMGVGGSMAAAGVEGKLIV